MGIGDQTGCIKTAYRSTLTIDGQQIGDGQPVYIIAEIGRTFDNIDTAKKLITEAAKAGANAVKIQSIDASGLLVKNERTKEHYDTLVNLELTLAEHKHLKDYANNYGLTFLSTPESLDMVKLLEEIGITAYKIASLDLTYHELIRYIAMMQKPIFLSTGMASMTEIEKALNVIRFTGNGQIALLYCVSLYPPSASEMDLRTIQTFKNLGIISGFSDHTLGISAALASVALGAKVIEKHFTLDRLEIGADHKIALNPIGFSKLVYEIRQVEAMLGSGQKIISTREQAKKQKKLRKIIAAEDLKKGTTLKGTMLRYLQLDDTTGLSPDYYNSIVGKVLKFDVKKDKPIDLDTVK